MTAKRKLAQKRLILLMTGAIGPFHDRRKRATS